jgi:hypothetical protein
MAARLARFGRRSEHVWRHVTNRDAVRAYRRGSSPRSALGERLVGELAADGCAVTSVEELFGDTAVLEGLTAEAAALEEQRRDALESSRASSISADAVAGKDYVLRLGGRVPTLHRDSPLLRTALHPAVVEIANGYLGMVARLRYANIWRSLVTGRPPRSSQHWHQDRDDLHRIFKMFIYLSDVHEGAGPLVYAPGTHRRRSRGPRVSHFDGNSARVLDGAMADVVPEAAWRILTGSPGTVALVDTRGLHKGGHPLTEERLVYTCMFTSPWAAGAGELVTFAGDLPDHPALGTRPTA